uniref:glutathione transferase n=1 Tax=Acrobeloides nanus TaxID=290746 RepID=A0A914EFT6_9BILA
MVQYKLTYFPVRGLGEIARLILHYANVTFEDVRMAQDDWPNYKNKTPFGQLPVLEVDGKPLAQSFAIARFLARKHGLAGKDDWESAQIDSIADFMKDLANECRPYFGVVSGRMEGDKDKLYNEVFKPCIEKNMPILEKLLKESGSGFFAKSGDKDKLYNEVFKPCIEKNMPILEKLLKESGSGFFAKSGVSWVDFFIANSFETMEGFAADLLGNYKELLAHKERVYSLPQIKTYIASRPKTPF